MAIRINLERVLGHRGITLTELAGRVGITLANMSVLKTNKARAIRFSTLDALCRELHCQPGDLMEWVPGEAEAADPAEWEEVDRLR
ncbi:MAG: helix-turn-helix transcriptional regulator [Paludibaculum sp.]